MQTPNLPSLWLFHFPSVAPLFAHNITLTIFPSGYHVRLLYFNRQLTAEMPCIAWLFVSNFGLLLLYRRWGSTVCVSLSVACFSLFLWYAPIFTTSPWYCGWWIGERGHRLICATGKPFSPMRSLFKLQRHTPPIIHSLPDSHIHCVSYCVLVSMLMFIVQRSAANQIIGFKSWRLHQRNCWWGCVLANCWMLLQLACLPAI